jgi:hypothetical protein
MHNPSKSGNLVERHFLDEKSVEKLKKKKIKALSAKLREIQPLKKIQPSSVLQG